ncbi:hypothetical protein GGR32_002229 [Mesonia hippocampi]|uniref:Uncharacterized protein n=1 Tax=Mesonia hippocampi TaxID=1628250 RepID=A0A840EYM7_9FLAO|nr:hypothetical protein [Mesonia hippocampi]MBB4119917.1 hypothetical protein [Mesonia hippocampi]
MAEQLGIIKLRGTIGGISFYKTSDGYLAREKGGVSAKRIATDAAFQRTRENNAEFATAGKAGKLIRTAIQVLLQNAKDKRCVGRLTRNLLGVVKTDSSNARGARKVQDGNMQLLKGFEFNQNGKLGATLFTPFECTLDRTAGTLSLQLASYQSAVRISAPQGTTHYRLNFAGASLDFEQSNFNLGMEQTSILPHSTTEQAASTLTATVEADSVLPVIGVLGVEFFQEVNAEMYPLKNGAYNTLAVVLVDQV